MTGPDFFRAFLFEQLDIRAALVRLGPSWQAMQAGRVRVAEGGRLLRSAGSPEAPAVQLGSRAELEPGARFQALPYDAALHFQGADGGEQGPWKAAGGTRPPPDAPLRLDGEGVGPSGAVLDEATRKALEALGYVQE